MHSLEINNSSKFLKHLNDSEIEYGQYTYIWHLDRNINWITLLKHVGSNNETTLHRNNWITILQLATTLASHLGINNMIKPHFRYNRSSR